MAVPALSYLSWRCIWRCQLQGVEPQPTRAKAAKKRITLYKQLNAIQAQEVT